MSKLETLVGYTELEITRKVPRMAEGKPVLDDKAEPIVEVVTETVRVRKVPIRNMQKLAAAWQNESKEIGVYCDKDAAWVETLSDESYEAIVEEGRRLNAAPFGKWFSRHVQALDAMGISPEEAIRLNSQRLTSS